MIPVRSLSGLAALAFVTGASASDRSEQIPAPTVQLRAAGVMPTPQQLVTSSAIPVAKVEVIPLPDPRNQPYGNYNAGVGYDSGGPASSYRRDTAAPSVNVVR